MLDAEIDWEHAHVILDALGDEGLDWQSIVGLLDRQPAMHTEWQGSIMVVTLTMS